LKTKRQTSILSLIFIVTFSLLTFIGAALADPVQVVVIPFEINAEKNLDFLKAGIQDMLSSRLSWKDKVVVMDKTAVNTTVKSLGNFKGESLALLAGGQLKADYIISGSVTVIGQGASIDATLRDITGKIAPVTFFGQTNSLGGVIPEINRFATDVNERVFQRRTGSGTSNTFQTLSQNTPATPSANNATTPNPMLKSASSGWNKSAINPNFKTTGSSGSNTGFWKSPSLPLRITGVDVGDVNNDGLLETVVLTEKAIIIYQMVNNRMVKATEIPTSKLSHPLGLDIGDVNGNGTPEIFISSLAPERNRANSYVLEFNGRSYPAITTNTPWYYRISKKMSGELLLLGQKQRKRSADIHTAPVYEMKYQKNGYIPHRKILKGKTANVLGIAVGEHTPNSPLSVAALDTAEHLTLFTETGTLAWRNREPSGGSMSVFWPPKEQADDDQEFQFFPLRIRINDMDGDGIPEILSATNHDNSMGLLSNLRSYDRGILESRSWKETEMILNWKTSPLPGRISDFVVADFDNDGIEELVVATVTEEGATVMSQPRSRLVAYDLIVPQGN
jgi:hypothetical protein